MTAGSSAQAESARFALPQVEEEDIADIVAEWTGIPVARLNQSDSAALQGLEGQLHERVVGQNEVRPAHVACCDPTCCGWGARQGVSLHRNVGSKAMNRCTIDESIMILECSISKLGLRVK